WRWWLLYASGAVLAVYSEYDSATALVPLLIGLAVLAAPPRWPTLLLGSLPALALLPWVHQLVRSLDELDVTKTGGGYLTVTPASIRAQLVTLIYGETGHGAGAPLKTLALIALVAVVALGAVAMRRAGPAQRPLLMILAWAGLGTLLLHALAPVIGVGIFDVGYLTFLIPLGCVAFAAAVASLPIRGAVPLAFLALALVGAGLTVKRLRNDSEPDPGAISALVRAGRARTVLTNSAVIAYYLRGSNTILDRPFNLGHDLERDCARCHRPIAVVDDANVGAGARPGPGTTARVGHYTVRFVP